MLQVFPKLTEVPQDLYDLALPHDRNTNRPRVWDENGVPLDSFYSKTHSPARNPDDHTHINSAVGYELLVVQDVEGFGVNIGLMDYLRPDWPQTLHLMLDVARAYRATRAIPETEVLLVDEALTAVIGLNSLWSLLMYRRDNRVANGALPVHVAHAHRAGIGYEGLLAKGVKLAEIEGISASRFMLTSPELTDIALANLKGGISRERCPAGPRMIGEASIALLDPPDQAFEQLLPTLAVSECPRLLQDMGVDDALFTHFALAVRQSLHSRNEQDFEVVRQLLLTA